MRMFDLLIFLHSMTGIDVKESPRHLELAVIVSPMSKEHVSFSQKLCLLSESRVNIRRFGNYRIKAVSSTEVMKFFRVTEGNEPSRILSPLPGPLTPALYLSQLIFVTIGLIFLNMKVNNPIFNFTSLSHKMRILTLAAVVIAENPNADDESIIKCAHCTGMMLNGGFTSGKSCFDGTQEGWVEGHPSKDTTPACQTFTNNQTHIKHGIEEFVVGRDWSPTGYTTDSIMKQSK